MNLFRFPSLVRPAAHPERDLRFRALAAYLVLYMLSGGGLLPVAWADTAYVDPVNGDDSRSVAEAKNALTPWQTLTKALDEAEVGANNIDVIEAASGTYDDGLESFPLELISGVTLRGQGPDNGVTRGAASVIEHDDTIFEAINVSLNNDTVIEGFTLDGQGGGSSEEELILLSGTFDGSEAVSHALVIRNNEFRNFNGNAIHGDYSESAHVVKLEVYGNRFADLGGDGIDLDAEDLNGESGTIGAFSPMIYGNVFGTEAAPIVEDALDIDLTGFISGAITVHDNAMFTTEGAGLEFDWESPESGGSEASNFVSLTVTKNVMTVGEDGVDVEIDFDESGSSANFEALIAFNDITAQDTGIDVFQGSAWNESAFLSGNVEILNNTVTAGQRGIEFIVADLTLSSDFRGSASSGHEVQVHGTIAGNQVIVNEPESSGSPERGGDFSDFFGDGIFVGIDDLTAVSTGTIDVVVQNNVVSGAWDDGIQVFVFSSSFSDRSAGGVASGPDDARGGGEGPGIGNIDITATLAGNTISGVADHGIEIIKGSPWVESYSTVDQSIFLLGNDIDGAPSAGIYIDANSETGAYQTDRNEVVGNVITNGASFGFEFDQELSLLSESHSGSTLIAECNTLSGNLLGGAVFWNYGGEDGTVGINDWGGGGDSNGNNVFLNVNGLVARSTPYDMQNSAYSSDESSANILAQNNYWGDNDPSDQVLGAVDFSNPLLDLPSRNVSVLLASEVETDNGDPGLTPGDIVRYTATIISDGDCGCAAAEFNAPVPEGSTLVEDSVSSVDAKVRAAIEPEQRGVDLSDPDEGLVRVGLGGLGVETIEVTWLVEFGGCEAAVEVDLTCSQLGTVTSNQVVDTVEVFELAVTKTDGLTQATPGTAHQYTIEITGDVCPVTGVSVVDDLPDVLLMPSWSCTASLGSTCTASDVGDIDDTVDIAAGGTLTYVIDSVINTIASGTLTNTVTVDSADDARGLNVASATDETELLPVPPPVITATKTVGGEAQVGGTLTYQIVLTNSSPTFHPDNPGDEFVDVLPPGLELISAVADSGTVTTSGTDTVMWSGQIPGNGTVTIDIQALVLEEAEDQTLENQGIVTVDGDLDGTSETDVLTDDPVPPGAEDPTAVTIGRGVSPLEIPTLGSLGAALMVLMLSGCAVLVLGRRFGS